MCAVKIRLFLTSALLLLFPCLAPAGELSSPAAPALSADAPSGAVQTAAAVTPGKPEGGDMTTFLVDRFAEAQRGTDWEDRKRMLVEYGAFANPGNEVSLREFRNGAGLASKAIGEGKASLVFHMLRKAAGEEQFAAAQKEFIGLAKFRTVSWDDVKAVFEKHAGRDLGHFFKQWVDEKGLPDLRIEKAAARRSGSGFEVSFDVVQRGGVYTLELPVVISLVRGGPKKETVRIDSEKKKVTIAVEEEPTKLAVDEDYDVARSLAAAETPPVIAELLGSEKTLIVPPASRREFYRAVVEGFTKKGGEEKDAGDLKDSEIKSASLVILGQDNPVIARLFGAVTVPASGFSIQVRKNPWNSARTAAIIHARSAEEAEAGSREIALYGAYGSVSFEQGKVLSAKKGESPRGMQMELREETTAVDVSALRTLKDVIEGAAGKKIVYVGEYHDQFSHHNVELEVIRGLHRKDPRIAVGMEMFQRPFQPALDDYVAGAIDEREFLKRSEYFKRWGFDYNLYKPVLDFCRAEKVPVVALNIRREITEKVSKSGMDSLTGDERKELPAQMDFSDEDYRKRLKEVFEAHRSAPEREFDYFYQAQVLWDESMAQSVDEFLRKQPDRRMVVVAGGGHLARGSGIPKRAFRRNGQEYAIILNDGEIERGVADYVVFPPSLDGAMAPKILAALKEDGGKVTITGFFKESPAKKAGLEAEDVILAADGVPVKDAGDLKLVLFSKKSGDSLTVKALRKRFLLGDKEMAFEIKL
jgi:uncharacterized iron-regulated protein